MKRESAAVLAHFLTRNGWIENRLEACKNLFGIYKDLGETDKAYGFLLKSLLIAPPRSETCCLLGGYFLGKNDLNSAVYWYKCALTCADAGKSGGFVNVDYCGYIPNLQLCVIYDRLGDYATASAYNEAAGAIKPFSEQYLFNKNYFDKKLKKEV